MKKVLSIFLCCLFTHYQLVAQEQLTEIISADDSPSMPQYLGTVNGKIIFTAYNPIVGRELWATDGTPTGTYLIKDIVPVVQPGLNGQNISTVIKDGYLYFSASILIPAERPELWRTDGTAAGTTRVLESIISETDLSVAGTDPDRNYRPIYLLNSDDYFFIVIQYSNKRIVKRYSLSFQSVRIDYLEGGSGVPALYNNEVYPSINSFAFMENIKYQDSFSANNTLYQNYIASAVRDNTPEHDWVRILSIKNYIHKTSSIKAFQHPGSAFLNARSFIYNNKFYTWLILEKTSEDKASVEVTAYQYVLDEDKGFQLIKTVPIIAYDPERTFNVPAMWPTGTSLNIIYSSVPGGLLAGTFKHISINLDSYQLKEESVLEDVYPFYPISANNEVFLLGNEQNRIYDSRLKKVSTLTIPTVTYLQKEISPNQWFLSANPNLDFEPYLLNTDTGNLSLLKDINEIGKGISKMDTINGKVVLMIKEKTGLNMYSSDGTKNSLKFLSTISSTFVPEQPNTPNTYQNMIEATRYGDELVYRVMGHQFSYTAFSYLYAVTNGIGKTFTLFETDKSLATSIVHKTGGSYYHAFAESNAIAIDSMTIVRYNADGVQNGIKKVNIAFEQYSYNYIFNIKIVDDKYLVFGNLETYTNADLQTVIDITTGARLDSSNFIYVGAFNNRIFFKKIVGEKWDIYTIENNNPVKIIEGLYRSMNFLQLLKKCIFYDTISMYVYNTITNETIKVSGSSIPQSIASVKEMQEGILFRIDPASGSIFREVTYKLLKGNTFQDVTLSGEHYFPSDHSMDIHVNGKNYYFMTEFNYSKGFVYTYNGTDFEEVGSFNISTYPFAISNGKGYFYIYNDKLYFWSPTLGSKVLATGYTYFSKEWQSGQNILFKVNSASTTETVFVMTDGTPEGAKIANINIPYQTDVVLRHKNKIYLKNNTPNPKQEFWETDGTLAGTKKIASFDDNTPFFSEYTVINDIPICLVALREQGKQLFSLRPTLDAPIIAVPNSQACEGEEVLLTAPKDYDNYLWKVNNTEEIRTTTNKLSVKKAGSYQVIVKKGEKASLPSNIVSINFVALPPKPTITLTDLQLVANTEVPAIQWYLNNTIVAGATQKNLTYTGSGDYTVKVTANNCSNTSDAFKISITSVEESNISTKIYPNPSSTKLLIEQNNQTQPTQIILTDTKGRTILKEETSQSKFELDISGISRGIYILKVNAQTKKIVIE